MFKIKFVLNFCSVIYLTFIILNEVSSETTLIGEACTVARTGTEGVCKLIQNCPKALQDIKHRVGYPSVCGYKDFKQIICCSLDTGYTTQKSTEVPINASISKRKCSEYKKFAYVNQSSYIPEINQYHINSVLKCSFDSLPLIIGGTAAVLHEFPHMATIGYQNNNEIAWKCGGTLISDEFVLTAAHCTASGDYGNATHVRLGELNLNAAVNDGANPIDIEISEIILHPKYKSSLPYNDIALIRLKEKISLNECIRPACLPTTYNTGTKRAIISGWGATKLNGDFSDKLLKVNLEIFNHTECNVTYAQDVDLKIGIVDETQLCAGSHTQTTGSCQGDDGGPLQVYHPSETCMYTVVGITSIVKSCGTINVPSVYTRVYSYVNWIEGNVWPNDE